MNAAALTQAHSTHSTDCILYLESSLPLGMTLAEYRRARPRSATRWQRLRSFKRAS